MPRGPDGQRWTRRVAQGPESILVLRWSVGARQRSRPRGVSLGPLTACAVLRSKREQSATRFCRVFVTVVRPSRAGLIGVLTHARLDIGELESGLVISHGGASSSVIHGDAVDAWDFTNPLFHFVHTPHRQHGVHVNNAGLHCIFSAVLTQYVFVASPVTLTDHVDGISCLRLLFPSAIKQAEKSRRRPRFILASYACRIARYRVVPLPEPFHTPPQSPMHRYAKAIPRGENDPYDPRYLPWVGRRLVNPTPPG